MDRIPQNRPCPASPRTVSVLCVVLAWFAVGGREYRLAAGSEEAHGATRPQHRTAISYLDLRTRLAPADWERSWAGGGNSGSPVRHHYPLTAIGTEGLFGGAAEMQATGQTAQAQPAPRRAAPPRSAVVTSNPVRRSTSAVLAALGRAQWQRLTLAMRVAWYRRSTAVAAWCRTQLPAPQPVQRPDPHQVNLANYLARVWVHQLTPDQAARWWRMACTVTATWTGSGSTTTR